MKNLRLVAAGWILASCCGGGIIGSKDECFHDDFLYFRILSMTGEDLFTGANPKYTLDQLKLYKVDDGARVDHENIFAESDRLGVLISEEWERIIVEVNDQPKDTVDITFEITHQECCDKQSRIKTTIVDGQQSDYDRSKGIDIKIAD
jgi:hypothetical protein